MKCSKCSKMHPTLLHLDDFRPSKPAADKDQKQSRDVHLQSKSLSCSATASSPSANQAESVVLHSILPVKVRQEGNGEDIITYAFFDNGSNGCFLTQELKEQLGAHGEETT